MVPVTMGEDDSINARKIDSKPGSISLQHIILGASVEHDRVRHIPFSGRDEKRKPVICAALRFARKVVHPVAHQARPFERDMSGNGRQAVQTIVHKDKGLDAVDSLKCWLHVSLKWSLPLIDG